MGNKILERYNSDPDFRKKLIVGSIMGTVGLIIALIGIFYNTNENSEAGDKNEKIAIQNYSDRQLDTTLINKGTSDYRKMEFQKDTILDDMNTSYAKNENSDIYMRNSNSSTGGSSSPSYTQPTPSSGGGGGGGAALDEYVKRRNQSIERVYNSQPSSSVVVPTNQRDIVVKDYSTRSNNIENYSSPSSVVSHNSAPSTNSSPINYSQSDNSSSSKQLSKEEKLKQAIANKYGKTSQEKTNVVAQVYNNQKIASNNASVRLLLKDKLYYNNVVIGTDAFVYGNATINGDKVTISVPSITYKGNNYPVNLVVYDYRTGVKGIPVKMDNIVGVAGDVVENQAQQQISRYGGKVGQILSQVASGRNKNASIQLNDGHLVYLKTQ